MHLMIRQASALSCLYLPGYNKRGAIKSSISYKCDIWRCTGRRQSWSALVYFIRIYSCTYLADAFIHSDPQWRWSTFNISNLPKIKEHLRTETYSTQLHTSVACIHAMEITVQYWSLVLYRTLAENMYEKYRYSCSWYRTYCLFFFYTNDVSYLYYSEWYSLPFITASVHIFNMFHTVACRPTPDVELFLNISHR